MKRFVVVMTVWAMGLAGVLAGVVFPSTASAAPIIAALSAASDSYTPVATARVFDGQATTTTKLVQIAGTYTVVVFVYNDADGVASVSTVVTVG